MTDLKARCNEWLTAQVLLDGTTMAGRALIRELLAECELLKAGYHHKSSVAAADGVEILAIKTEISRLRGEVERLTPMSVVAAVIRTSEGNYLIGERKQGQWMAGYWCFVGGKVENGETLKQAVAREIREELGIEVTVGPLVHEQIEKYDHGMFHLHYFACEMDLGQVPKLLECSDVASVPPARLPEYKLLPVDIDIAERLKLQSDLDRHKKLVERLREGTMLNNGGEIWTHRREDLLWEFDADAGEKEKKQ